MNADRVMHTPGPWTFRENRDASLDFFGNGTVFACHVRLMNHGANARLIAAAPDLLNALTVLADAAQSRGIPVDAARAAIAKATGEQA